MWQTKYALAIPTNLGVGVDFRPFSEGDFLSSVVGTINDALGKDPLKNCHGLSFCTIVSQERPLEIALENTMQDL